MPETSTEVVQGPFPSSGYESMGLIAWVVHLSGSLTRASSTLTGSATSQAQSKFDESYDYVDSWRIGDPFQNYIDYRSPMPGFGSGLLSHGHGKFWEGPGVVYYAQ